MRSLLTLLLALIVSGLVAAGVQVQLGIYFNADVELAIAMAILAVMTLATTLALGLALFLGHRVVAIDRVALSMAGVAVAALAVLIAIGGTSVLGPKDLAILAEIFMPVLIMIAIQWWLVRRFGRANAA